MARGRESGEARKQFEQVARIVKGKPERIKGFLVVAFPHEGNAGINHNGCCVRHLIEELERQLEFYPELNLVNPEDRESHGS